MEASTIQRFALFAAVTFAIAVVLSMLFSVPFAAQVGLELYDE